MARDPRYRPFRIGVWVVYLTLVAVSIGLTVRSVARNLRGPPRPSATLPTRAAARVCLTELEALHREQTERAWRLGTEIASGADAVPRWQAWSHEWARRVDDLSGRCLLDAGGEPGSRFPGRAELAAARDAVLRVHRAYTLQVNRFAQDDVNLARGAADALRAAQVAVGGAAAGAP